MFRKACQVPERSRSLSEGTATNKAVFVETTAAPWSTLHRRSGTWEKAATRPAALAIARPSRGGVEDMRLKKHFLLTCV